MTHILGIHIQSRTEEVPDVQPILTRYGCNIKTRIGLHDATEQVCSPSGIILLEIFGDASVLAEMRDKLNAIPGVSTKTMTFP